MESPMMMTTRTQHRVVALASGLTACTLLAACGSGSSPGRTVTPPLSSTAGSPSSALSAMPTTATADLASTSAAGTASAGSGSACALVTEHDAATALGSDPGRGSAFSSYGSTQCQYGTYQTQFLLVNLTPSRGRAGYDIVHSHQRAGQNVRAVDIAGVGDRAFEVTAPHTAGIYANKGDALLVVTITKQAALDPPTVPVLALARLAAGRL
ncbi:MAG TPA: hypothetical protein VGN18_01330 [Jatrophihabitans sp.]|jgi:hypothetical protein|uniref:hypothetical protein n=1 Tax=Jatrophihabitans sp. TaxID=1932789 RepID=UPI002E071A09|nr:hypothetical protein [Jatrophihabitans sp.]